MIVKAVQVEVIPQQYDRIVNTIYLIDPLQVELLWDGVLDRKERLQVWMLLILRIPRKMQKH
jgi:hypothetical protein